MECAVGLCGHCQYREHFVCKDGPVFSYRTLKELFGQSGI
jgi:sulfhydrogenase subunit gamma (sulfur reductase)